MLGLVLFRPPEHLVKNPKLVNRDLIKFDCDPLTRDVESFLQFFFSFKDVNTLRKAVYAEPFGKYGCVIQRFFHLVNLYKVPYNGQAFVNPRELFPNGGKEQRSAFLLNYASAAIYACLSKDYAKSHSADFYGLCTSVIHFVPFTVTDVNHWSVSFHVEALTQLGIRQIRELADHFKIRSGKVQGKEMREMTLKLIDGIFSSSSHPLVVQRYQVIQSTISTRFTLKGFKISDVLSSLAAQYPIEDFLEKLGQFIRNCYNSLTSMTPIESSSAKEEKSSESSSTRKRHSLNGRQKKRRKLSKLAISHTSSESEADVLVCTFDLNNESLTQVPATNKQPNSTAATPPPLSNNSTSQEDREIISSMGKPEQVSSPTQEAESTQSSRYEHFSQPLAQMSNNKPSSKKTYKFYRKPGKFLSQFQPSQGLPSSVDIEQTRQNENKK